MSSLGTILEKQEDPLRNTLLPNVPKISTSNSVRRFSLLVGILAALTTSTLGPFL